jgi:glycosyltransferase involved in cell wall biosynthesis
LDKHKVLVIIPAYNEEKNIADTIKKVMKHADVKIVVINDGSKDSTLEEAIKTGATVIDLPFNLGIGGAMQTGYIYAQENGFDVAIQVDADGQHDPGFLNCIIEVLTEGNYDMVIGSRYIAKTGYKSPFARRMGMMFFSELVFFLTGKRIKDTTSGFRAVNRNVIEYFAGNYPSDYPEVDVLVRLHKKKFKIQEVPVKMLKRQGGTSSITLVKSIYYMSKVSLALLINSLRTEDIS